MNTVTLELENTLRELDPASATSLEQVVWDVLRLARQRRASTQAGETAASGFPTGHFERLVGSWAGWSLIYRAICPWRLPPSGHDAPSGFQHQSLTMSATVNFKEIQRRAYALPDSERATLAAGLMASLPPVLVDEDDGVAEALRRSREMGTDPALACSWDVIKQALGR